MLVGVTVFPESGDTPIATISTSMLHGIVTTDYVPFPPHPAYVAHRSAHARCARSGGGRVRIEVTNYGAITSRRRCRPIWAFVSLTNNETNQVTMVTPK